MGASASYVFTKDEVITVEGNAYSIGTLIHAEPIGCHSVQLSSEALIILSSDGASLKDANGFGENFIQNHRNMKYLAKQLLLCSNDEISDDKTVIAISVKVRLREV